MKYNYDLVRLLVSVVAETGQTGDSVGGALPDELTAERSAMMEGIRKQLLGDTAAANGDAP